MRLTVFTNTKIITLEGGAKDIFMNLVLTPDENNQVMPVQTYVPVMMTRVENLQLGNGIDAFINKQPSPPWKGR